MFCEDRYVESMRIKMTEGCEEVSNCCGAEVGDYICLDCGDQCKVVSRSEYQDGCDENARCEAADDARDSALCD